MTHTSRTKLLAVIGNPIEHSMSPLIHGAAIEAKGIDFAYVAFRVEDAGAAVAAMRALPIRGFSVTIPHKESVIAHLDALDVSARRCRSVNTIINNNGFLTGYSTDGAGAVKALQAAEVDPSGRNVLIVGTGGAARAISFALIDAGIASLRFRVEDKVQAEKLRADIIAEKSGILSDDGPIDLLINASPVGMHPHVEAMPVDPDELRPGMAVFDIVYNPIRTKLLREAEARGLQTVSGVDMFAEQAALQFELFTQTEAPRQLMREVVRKALEGK